MLNISPFFDRQYKVYSENVKSRNKLHYLIGLYVRWKQHFKYVFITIEQPKLIRNIRV